MLNKRYCVKEAFCDENQRPTSAGRVIASDLSEEEAGEMLARLYSDNQVWWKEVDGEPSVAKEVLDGL